MSVLTTGLKPTFFKRRGLKAVEAALSRIRLVNRPQARVLKEIPLPAFGDSCQRKWQTGVRVI
ncbi:MAG: hypothetical protein ACM3UW_02660 [Bacillota bacterium]